MSLDDPLRVPSEFADDNLTDNTAAVTVTALANVVGGEGGTGGALPVTGAKTSTLALGGFALLSAGLVVRYATRRRTA